MIAIMHFVTLTNRQLLVITSVVPPDPGMGPLTWARSEGLSAWELYGAAAPPPADRLGAGLLAW
jgi:hypothetical protein